MPKEFTHWHIAREALQRGAPIEVGEIIASNPALYYIGAIAHDIPFYDLSEPSEVSIERIANQLHGAAGENTLAPLCEIMERALSQTNKQGSFAFLLGMLTHYVADSMFHPMVYYMSGNYFADDLEERSKAVFRHRLLETAIDLWLQTIEPMEYPVDLNHLWREAGEPGRQALKLLATHYTYQGDKGILIHFMKAWRNHRFLQTAFSWSIPWRALTIYRHYGHPKAEKLEALFYSQPLDLSFFGESLSWLHPVSGESNEMSLKQLYDLSVNKVIILFEQLAKHPIEKWHLHLRELPPLSLDSGLPYVPVAQMKFFRTEPIEHHLRSDIRTPN
ncbi:zinc dependent phospholipase C family protein [Desulfosporosinus lacus]|uniref:Zinc dependent phospholipase C n=1 Tax=Desulfosporosinus lacus DSM 15449 TaxID=1121420 RepID=A0A1M5XNY3_9FIRM|nr:zinc dependent phospholipase C family protein [Desulfosporosinus lacus]SHI01511.1 Zinc dependent phospholipase C [Desulfosporosinus lacus DSM 15449]